MCLHVHESGHVFIQATRPVLNHLLAAEGIFEVILRVAFLKAHQFLPVPWKNSLNQRLF